MSITSRRQFIQASAVLTAGVALASGDESRGEERTAPLDIAVIGTGARGCDLIRALTTIAAVKVVAVCDPYGPHLERGWQYAGPLARTFGDHRKLLEEMKPQAVVIAVPLVSHFEICRDALDADCAVFCEKTMCYSVEQAQKLVALVEGKRAVFQVGLQRRANAIYRQAAAMVQTGMLGRITAIQCQWHRNDNWRRPVPVPRGDAEFEKLDRQLNWRLYRESSQGLMAELGAHQIDVANWFLGATPKSVFASGGTDFWRDGREVFDNIHCLYEYEVSPRKPARGQKAVVGTNEEPYTVRVSYSSLQNNAYAGASELIFGTSGTLFLSQKKGLFFREVLPESIDWTNRADKQANVVTSGKTLKLSNDPWAHRGAPFEIDTESDDTRDELVSFIDHVRQADPATICSVREGLNNTISVHLANDSATRQAIVKWPEALV
jgi:predicted dehydrogenase